MSAAGTRAERPTEYEAAPLWRRFAAYTVDASLVILIVVMPLVLFSGHDALLAVMFLLNLATALSYHLFGDGIFGGAALGKRLFGIYVVDAKTRQPCSPKQALLRMCYQWFHLFALIDGLVLICDGLQRWGDRTAGTYVLLRHPKTPPPPKELRPVDFAAIRASLKKP